ncbi:hypothetical protein GNY06_00590, partial [Elizabethkingia argentiflava]
YSIKFYVAGGRSGLQEFEGLNVFVHIELLTSVENILEFDQIDPIEEFNILFEKGELNDGVSFKI